MTIHVLKLRYVFMIRYGVFRPDMSLHNEYSTLGEARAAAHLLEELGYSVEVHTILSNSESSNGLLHKEIYSPLVKMQ